MAPRLAEHGKIKLGRLGDKRQKKDGSGFYQMPTRLDHFLITTTERDNTGNFIPNSRLMEQIAERVGERPDHLTKIPVILLYDEIDQNFYTSYNSYQGKTRICTGDGQTATVLATGEQIPCPCPKLDREYKGPTPCKPYGRLSVIIQDMNIVGSVWVFRTTGWNSVQDLLGSLALIKKITGRLSGIKLMLKVMPKTVQIKRGATTVYTVSLIYEGSVAALVEESSVRPMLKHDETLSPDQTIKAEEEAEIAEEFFPPETETERADATAATVTEKKKEPTEKKEPTAAELAKETKQTEDAKKEKQEKAKATASAKKEKARIKKEQEEAKDRGLAAEEKTSEAEQQTEDTSREIPPGGEPPIDEEEVLDEPVSDNSFGWV